MQRVHFQVWVCVFTCQHLDKDFFRYLLYCDKKQIECGLAWYWWNSTNLGLIDMSLINLNTEIVACILPFWKILPNMFFSPDLGGKIGGVLSMRMQVILDSSFTRPGSATIWDGRNGEFRDWTRWTLECGRSQSYWHILVVFGSWFFCLFTNLVLQDVSNSALKTAVVLKK